MPGIKGKFAEVIVDLAAEKLDRPFTYLLPEELQESAQLGGRVLVPFGGNRKMEGYIVGFSDETDLPEEKLKAVGEVLTGSETVEGRLVGLAAFMKKRYGGPMALALRTAFPARKRIRAVQEKFIFLKGREEAEAFRAGLKKSQKAMARVMDELLSEDGLPQKELLERTAASADTIKRLAAAGVIEVRTVQELRRPNAEAGAPGADALSEAQAAAVEKIRREWGWSAGNGAEARGADSAERAAGEALGAEDVLSAESAKSAAGEALGAKSAERAAGEALGAENAERAAGEALSAENAERAAGTARFSAAARIEGAGAAAAGAGAYGAEGPDGAALPMKRPVLLRGVTGSGKTLVYMELIAEVLEKGGQAIVLIPEISLTRQTVRRFIGRFGDAVSFMHSRLSDGERYDQMKAARSGKVSVMVGPRSALFTPFPNLALIVIDEEHEDTYHSEQTPRYRSHEVAIERGRLEDARVLFGSATPSVESAAMAEAGMYFGVELKSRYGGAVLPETEIVDLRSERRVGKGIFSEKLAEEIRLRLSRGEQTMLFLNRRGYVPYVACRDCGEPIKCPHCDVSLTRHLSGELACHYCGYTQPAPKSCKKCGGKNIFGTGYGTEHVEEEAQNLFPAARILRMDFDTTHGKEGHSRILKTFEEGGADILIGTQMIVKGHDFPNVTLVGALLADLSLNASDFRSGERTYQLLAQAVGRAGRKDKAGKALIQTYQPEHYAVAAAAAQEYGPFYEEEMNFRRQMGYPPCGLMLSILASCTDEERLDTAMGYIRKLISRMDPDNRLRVLGPAPQSVGKVKDRYRKVIYLRNADRRVLIVARERIEKYVAANAGFASVKVEFDYVN